jgi:hypothetical protein
MTIKETIQKMTGMGFQPKGEDYDDYKTRDNYLRSLRRQRRIQLEEIEKQKLKKEIADFEMQKARKNLWGFSDKKDKVDLTKIKKMKMLGKI